MENCVQFFSFKIHQNNENKKPKKKYNSKSFCIFYIFMVNVPVTIQIFHLPQRRDITRRGKLC